MARFYTKEKSKHGTMCGSIISFPIELTETDPKDTVNRRLLPAGYLRCDGSVLFANQFPELAAVLGVGQETKFLKDGQVITNEQFQLPDLRNKHIRATTSSNIGLYNDLTVVDENGSTQFKSGIQLDVVQNIDSPYQLSYTGDFYILPQTVELRGEPRFTVDTGVYTATTEVPHTAFQPHLHRSTTTRHRQKDNSQNFFRSRQKNWAETLSTLNICQWFTNTTQPLCRHEWENRMVENETYYAQGTDTGNLRYSYYGSCFNGCLNFTSGGYCLWPEQGLCADEPSSANTWQNVSWDNRLDNRGDDKDCNFGSPGGNSGTVQFGAVTYEPLLEQECDCEFVLFGADQCNMNGQDNTAINSSTLENYGPNKDFPSSWGYNGQIKNLPFSSNDPDTYNQVASGVSNITTIVGETGNDGSHRHRINFNSDEEHTYKMITRAAFARADSGLVSKITIEKNNSKKADKYIQPYIVTEYLIKI